MSGGSLDYLYLKEAEELFTWKYREKLGRAIEYLQKNNLSDSKACKDLVAMKALIDNAVGEVSLTMEKIGDVLYSVEWSMSGDWRHGDVEEEVEVYGKA